MPANSKREEAGNERRGIGGAAATRDPRRHHLAGIIESDCAYRSDRLERRGQPQEEVRRSFVGSEICQSATFRAGKERHEK